MIFLVQNLKRVGRDFTPPVPETFAMVGWSGRSWPATWFSFASAACRRSMLLFPYGPEHLPCQDTLLTPSHDDVGPHNWAVKSIANAAFFAAPLEDITAPGIAEIF
jgi:hypothetical protein